MLLRIALASALLVLAACSPAAEAPAEGPEAVTPRNPFFGTWEMTHARIAPWWDQQGEEPAPDPAFSKFTLQAGAASGPPLLTCDKPHYATNLMPLRGLFQGMLPDPAKDAADLGFTEPDVTTLSFTCQSGTGDVLVDFPMRDDETILMGLDNVVYTFRRTGR